MNLAIHHSSGLEQLYIGSKTSDWEARGLVPWTTPALVRTRVVNERLCAVGLLRRLEVGETDEGFFEIFRHRLRREQGVTSLCTAEEKLLFLADHLSSVLWTGEHVVADVARKIGLRVCFGNTDPATFFPLSPVVSNAAADPPLTSAMVSVVAPQLMGLFLSSQFPSCRRVPGRDEPVQKLSPLRSVRSSGSKAKRPRAQP